LSYQSELATALQQGKFDEWQRGEFRQKILDYQQGIFEWVKKGCEFFEKELPQKLLISFPDAPIISLPEPPPDHKKSKDMNIASVAIPTGIGWALGGPVGAAVLGGASYIWNKATGNSQELENNTINYQEQVLQAYQAAAKNYLTRFSNDAFLVINQYEEKIEKIISFKADKFLETTKQNYQLQLLTNLFNSLEQELNT